MDDSDGSGTCVGSGNEMINKVVMVSTFKEQHINPIGYIQLQRQNPGGHPTQTREIEKVPA